MVAISTLTNKEILYSLTFPNLIVTRVTFLEVSVGEKMAILLFSRNGAPQYISFSNTNFVFIHNFFMTLRTETLMSRKPSYPYSYDRHKPFP